MTDGAVDLRHIQVLGEELAEAELLTLLLRRTLGTRLRTALGRTQRARSLGTFYTPVAVIEATATGAGRRPWRDRTLGIVDLLTGRVGLADRSLPPLVERAVPAGAVVPARVPPQQASRLWHEFFRDHIDRRRRPMRPPHLTLDSCERRWLPLQVLDVAGGRVAIDPVTRRADPVTLFPALAQLLQAGQPPSVPRPQEVS